MIISFIVTRSYSVKDQATTDRIVSANSANRLIFGDSYNGIRVDADYDKDVNVNVNDEQLTSSKETTETLKQEPSLPEVIKYNKGISYSFFMIGSC